MGTYALIFIILILLNKVQRLRDFLDGGGGIYGGGRRSDSGNLRCREFVKSGQMRG